MNAPILQNPSNQKGPLDLRSFFMTQRLQMGRLLLLIFIFTFLIILYFINLLQWSRAPEFGWSISWQVGSQVVVEVYGEAEKAGLCVGDRVLTVNNARVTSFHQLRQNTNREASGQNIYEVDRNGKLLTITVPNRPRGLSKAFVAYGVTWVFGIIFFAMGAAVFLMKPGSKASWAFLFCTFNAGLYIAFSYTSKFSPSWLENVFTYASVFLSASILHIAQVFPEERSWIRKSRLFLWIPYLLSLILFIIVRSSTPLFADAPAFWRTFTDLYRIGTFLIFLVSTLYIFLRPPSVLIRIRSEVMLIGFALAIGFPIIDLLANYLFNLIILPNPVFFLPFYAVLPLAIGYSIAKHNLFDVDVYVKRAVGYALMTILVGGTYFSIQVAVRRFILQPLFGDYGKEIYPILFALIVVFLFNPIRNHVQKIIDRVFYRLEYDYQETVQRISVTMRSLQSLDQIKNRIIDTILGVMFVESCGILLANAEQKTFEGLNISYDSPITKLNVSANDPFVKEVSDRKKEVTIYDVQEDPSYEKDREAFKEAFTKLRATLILPLIYEDRLIGLMSLGNKKSGNFYRREDINLLKTLANQGAVAIENAKLFEENIEKSRMEEELKIAHDIQLSMLPDRAPTIEGFSIAARSISAREVGGDFYDFIEIKENGTKRIGIVVGDVSGKAVSGALVMAASRSIFRVLTETHESVEEVMNRGNLRLHQDVKKGMFVALLYAVLDPKERTLTLSNAGQVQPVLFSAEKSKAEYIDTEGDRFPLGIVKKCHYQATRFTVNKGDILVFYTDGIVEAVNDKGELYGFERFLASIEEGRELGADELLEKLIKDVMQYVGKVEQHDDLTAVVVRVE